MSKILLNATTLVMGGALQACVSFIRKSMESDDNIEWHYAVSKEIAEELSKFDIDILNHKAVIITPSPARARKSREKLSQYLADLAPCAVFTFFGPAYIKVSQPHLMGVADGWITHSTKTAIATKNSIGEIMWFVFLFFVKRYWYKQANRWVVEAACAKKGMRKRFFIKNDDIAIVPNNCSDKYLQNIDKVPGRIGSSVKLLTLSAYYSHKNLEIIPRVAAELVKKAPHMNFEFTITVREGKDLDRIMLEAKRLAVESSIVNIGPVSVIDGPALYASTDIVFMPSVLETFSAVYPEAMMSGCPIVTTNLDFARDICADAACYYSPLDPESAANEITKIVNDHNLFNDLVKKGRERVTFFPNQDEKYQLYTRELKNMTIDSEKKRGDFSADSCRFVE